MTPDYILAHWHDQTDAQLAATLGLAVSTIRGRRRRLGLLKEWGR